MSLLSGTQHTTCCLSHHSISKNARMNGAYDYNLLGGPSYRPLFDVVNTTLKHKSPFESFTILLRVYGGVSHRAILTLSQFVIRTDSSRVPYGVYAAPLMRVG